MVLIKHGDLKFIFALQNKSECQNTVCAKFCIRKNVQYMSVCVTLLGLSISTAQDDPLQSVSSKKRETYRIKGPKENDSIF